MMDSIEKCYSVSERIVQQCSWLLQLIDSVIASFSGAGDHIGGDRNMVLRSKYAILVQEIRALDFNEYEDFLHVMTEAERLLNKYPGTSLD